MKLTDILNESQHLSYKRMNVGEEKEEKGMTNEEKREFLKAVSEYKKFGEAIYRSGNLAEVYESVKGIVETAQKVTLEETGDWFDKVTVNRHMKSMNESFKVFEKTIHEVNTLQQRLESCYDEMGEVLGKYYEIKEGNEFGAERAKAIAKGDDEFEVDGKKFPVTDVDSEDKENAKDFAEESVNEGKKSKDGAGVRYVMAIHNNVEDIHKLVSREKKDPKEVMSAFATPLLNSVKSVLKHNYKPHPADSSNDDKLKVFIDEVKKFEKIVELLIKRPSKAGVKKLEEAWRSIWNHKGGAAIGMNGQGPHADTIIESVNESKYTVINPKNGNVMGAGLKDQAAKLSKKMGGEKKGYYVIPMSNAKKARRALEKFNFDLKNQKLHSMLGDLYYESVGESVNEGKHDAILDKLADIVKGAKSFMDIGRELKSNGIKYSFGTNMIPMYIIDKPVKIAILNNKYADGAERVVGDTAIGLMESLTESINEESSMKLKDLLSESFGFGNLPSDKLIKMKKTLKEIEEDELVNEGASTEEKRIVMMAIKKIAKYRNVPLNYAVGDVLRAAEELERDIQKGKVK